MKRGAICSIITLLITIMALPIFASSYMVSITGPTQIALGDNVTFSVKINNIDKEHGIASMFGSIEYDNSVFEGIKLIKGEIWDSIMFNDENGLFVTTTESGKGITSDNELMQITAKVKSSAKTGKTTIKVTNISGSDGKSDLPTEDVSLTVTVVKESTECEHDYSAVGNDNEKHWKQCKKCKKIKEDSKASHTFDKATNDGGTTGTHSFKCTYSGCQRKETYPHKFGSDGKCTVAGCGAVRDTTCEHDYSAVGNDREKHWKQCKKCKKIKEGSEASHTFDKATNDGGTTGTHSFQCTYSGCQRKETYPHKFGSDGKCTVAGCDAVRDTTCKHDYSEVGNNNEKHWKKCKICGEIKEDTKVNHTLSRWKDNKDGSTHSTTCTYNGCKYKKTEKHNFDENGKCKKCLAIAKNNKEEGKNTMTGGKIPYTGLENYVIPSILIICGVAVVFYVRYNKIKNI